MPPKAPKNGGNPNSSTTIRTRKVAAAAPKGDSVAPSQSITIAPDSSHVDPSDEKQDESVAAVEEIEEEEGAADAKLSSPPRRHQVWSFQAKEWNGPLSPGGGGGGAVAAGGGEIEERIDQFTIEAEARALLQSPSDDIAEEYTEDWASLTSPTHNTLDNEPTTSNNNNSNDSHATTAASPEQQQEKPPKSPAPSGIKKVSGISSPATTAKKKARQSSNSTTSKKPTTTSTTTKSTAAESKAQPDTSNTPSTSTTDPKASESTIDATSAGVTTDEGEPEKILETRLLTGASSNVEGKPSAHRLDAWTGGATLPIPSDARIITPSASILAELPPAAPAAIVSSPTPQKPSHLRAPTNNPSESLVAELQAEIARLKASNQTLSNTVSAKNLRIRSLQDELDHSKKELTQERHRRDVSSPALHLTSAGPPGTATMMPPGTASSMMSGNGATMNTNNSTTAKHQQRAYQQGKKLKALEEEFAALKLSHNKVSLSLEAARRRLRLKAASELPKGVLRALNAQKMEIASLREQLGAATTVATKGGSAKPTTYQSLLEAQQTIDEQSALIDSLTEQLNTIAAEKQRVVREMGVLKRIGGLPQPVGKHPILSPDDGSIVSAAAIITTPSDGSSAVSRVISGELDPESALREIDNEIEKAYDYRLEILKQSFQAHDEAAEAGLKFDSNSHQQQASSHNRLSSLEYAMGLHSQRVAGGGSGTANSATTAAASQLSHSNKQAGIIASEEHMAQAAASAATIQALSADLQIQRTLVSQYASRHVLSDKLVKSQYQQLVQLTKEYHNRGEVIHSLTKKLKHVLEEQEWAAREKVAIQNGENLEEGDSGDVDAVPAATTSIQQPSLPPPPRSFPQPPEERKEANNFGKQPTPPGTGLYVVHRPSSSSNAGGDQLAFPSAAAAIAQSSSSSQPATGPAHHPPLLPHIVSQPSQAMHQPTIQSLVTNRTVVQQQQQPYPPAPRPPTMAPAVLPSARTTVSPVIAASPPSGSPIASGTGSPRLQMQAYLQHHQQQQQQQHQPAAVIQKPPPPVSTNGPPGPSPSAVAAFANIPLLANAGPAGSPYSQPQRFVSAGAQPPPSNSAMSVLSARSSGSWKDYKSRNASLQK